MVLLSMTPSIVEGLQAWSQLATSPQTKLQRRDNEPSLDQPSIGNPITHGQIIDLWQTLSEAGHEQYGLEKLLHGSRVYVPPPPAKPEPSPEFKALMARLRRDEEQRAYERMMNPAPPVDSFSQQQPSRAGMVHAFAEVNRPSREADIGDDDVTFEDVHRQLMLVLNFVVSILGVAASLWILGRWWSTPARLFLTMGGSALVGVAEVALYSGYIWHLGEAKKKDKAFREVKEVMHTWTVIGEDGASKSEPITVDANEASTEVTNIRRRKERVGLNEQ
ncbi:endoplasmic reticulum-based factor for assembly of V-ATPase-domain-containing protein [Podospora didyma]|uniref:Endoplasmic reticulum-based factor for assembly of V-ATPase-domain-containing protein n=1 Tax=Podospora didyma TaxID=330526 RepID=A0AAE0NP16_9PEZI|nr:endoplasmic reticulum-based factor for assembly of V-ATPase-domain-containing protein [Podospora didyma]